MVNQIELIQRDLKHIWHPCSHLKDFEQSPPLIIQHAKGSYLYTDRGPIIDGISSWWCKSLGHGHPAVIAAIAAQLQQFEHVIGATTTHPNIVELGELLHRLSGKQHLFFASDGSCAVEIALKLALQAAQIKGQPQRNHFIALCNGYHGETLAALGVSDLGLYKAPFSQMSIPCHFIEHMPYVQSPNDPLWHSCEKEWAVIEQGLETVKHTACALILEPIVQGAGGMRCYSAAFLSKLAHWAKKNGVYIIADEIMTGLGRTGAWFAADHAGVEADMICLSKGLTSGSIPLSCVLIDHSVYELFYQETDPSKAFLHSHTYSGNALAVSAALATLKTMIAEDINQQAVQLGQCMSHYFSEIAEKTGALHNVRGIGAIVAAEFSSSTVPRFGFRFAQEALARGALLRPLGNTLYWLPPLTTDEQTIAKLAKITLEAIESVSCGAL